MEFTASNDVKDLSVWIGCTKPYFLQTGVVLHADDSAYQGGISIFIQKGTGGLAVKGQGADFFRMERIPNITRKMFGENPMVITLFGQGAEWRGIADDQETLFAGQFSPAVQMPQGFAAEDLLLSLETKGRLGDSGVRFDPIKIVDCVIFKEGTGERIRLNPRDAQSSSQGATIFKAVNEWGWAS